MLVPRGDRTAIEALLPTLEQESEWAETAVVAKACRAMIQREAGEPKAALADARDASLATIASSFSHTPLEFGEAVECALAADAPEVIAELLARIDELQPVQLIPLLDAEAMRARALLARAGGDDAAATQWFRRAIDLFRELSTPFLSGACSAPVRRAAG